MHRHRVLQLADTGFGIFIDGRHPQFNRFTHIGQPRIEFQLPAGNRVLRLSADRVIQRMFFCINISGYLFKLRVDAVLQFLHTQFRLCINTGKHAAVI